MSRRQHPTTRRSEPQDLGRGAVNDQSWRSWSSVRAWIPDLPRGTTTYDIFKNLSRFGKLEYIRIEETRQGNFARHAQLTFKPPPSRRAPWDSAYRNGIDFTLREDDGDRTYTVRVWMSNVQPTTQLIESPVRRGLKYPSEMAISAHSIDFGYLKDPNTMIVKATRTDTHSNSIRMVLNLKRLEMEIHFPVMIESKGRKTERAYRFYVALDDQFSLHEVARDGGSALVVHVKNTPWYSRQLKEAIQLSHDDKSFRWTADDTWSRQTDIVNEKKTFQKIDNTPVSVQKLHNSINIARWTTFRLCVKDNLGKHDNSLKQFLTALKDFNIRIAQNPSFKVIEEPTYNAPIWNLLDGSAHRSFPEQFSSPHLDFELRYQLEVCISKGWLNEYALDSAFLQRLVDMPRQRAKQILIHVDTCEQRVYDHMSIFTDLRYIKPVRARAIPPNCAQIHHATVTATGVTLHTPSVEITNRIVRKYQPYSDRFLRVRFEDDTYRGQSRLYPATNGKMHLIFERVRRALRHGIIIGDRHYSFLAWGNSQLREHGVYFFASSQTPRITADDIRRDMGVFDREKIVAKRAARMGQCFSTTVPVPVLTRNSWRRDPIPDIKNGDYTFTDGVGKISRLAAQLVKINMKLKGPAAPSAFQFRLGGCKGVLAVDPTLSGNSVQIRHSQYKFECESDELEIIRISEFWQPFLNRQLVLVLSALGVPDSVFLQKQEACIQALDAALEDDTAALRALRFTVDPNQITLSIASMIEAGFSGKNEPVVASLLFLWRAWTLKYLKEKAKIPVSLGAFVLGVADETQTLRGHLDDIRPGPDATRAEMEQALPEIFIQYSDPQQKGVRRIVEGICVIARNPSLHRGDVRVVKAVDVPALHHLCDVLVMPTTGDRDLPSMCSGGDLDGDDYIVIWDPDLIPSEWNAEPFHYSAPDPIKKDHITTDDIINFFYDYMQNDFLGRIATAHLAAADYLDDGLSSEVCLKLVELHSMAVDYPKTGVPAEMSRDLERQNWPHFMEKKRAGTYRSRKILGQLFDAVERVGFQSHYEGAFDRRILMHKPTEALAETVTKLKKSYDESMRRIMAQHQIKSEFEVWSTFVLDHSKAARDFKFHEEIGQHAKTLKEQYHDAFCQEAGGYDLEKLKPFAVTAYHITNNELQEALQKRSSTSNNDQDFTQDEDSGVPVEPDMPLISFPWVLQDTLQKIARSTLLSDEEGATSAAKESPYHTEADAQPAGSATVHHWTTNGEHLPDPYVPITLTPELHQDGATVTAEEKLEQSTTSLEPQPADSTPRKTSLGTLPPIKLSVRSGTVRNDNNSPYDASSSASSNMSSAASSGNCGSANSGEEGIPPSSLLRSAPGSTSSSRVCGANIQNQDHLPILWNSTTVARPQTHASNAAPLQDPGLMTENETRALVGENGDSEDDFTF